MVDVAVLGWAQWSRSSFPTILQFYDPTFQTSYELLSYTKSLCCLQICCMSQWGTAGFSFRHFQCMDLILLIILLISFDTTETAGNGISTWQAGLLASGQALDAGILPTCHWSMHTWPCFMHPLVYLQIPWGYWDFYRALWNLPVKVKVIQEKTGQYLW